MVPSVDQLTDRGIEVGNAVVAAAREIGATPAQVALCWVLEKPGVVAPIIGALSIPILFVIELHKLSWRLRGKD